MVSRYQKRISGPLMDRIDIHIEVPRVWMRLYEPNDKLSDDRLEEPSAGGLIRQRVEAAQKTQQARFEGKG